MKLAFYSLDLHPTPEVSAKNILAPQPQFTLWQQEKLQFALSYEAANALTAGKLTLSCHQQPLAFQLSKAGFTEAYIGRGMTFGQIPTGPNETVADYLETIDPQNLNLPAGTSYLWVEAALPTALTGNHQVTLTFSGTEEIQLTCDVEILPLSLAELDEQSFSLELWQYPFAVARYYGLTEKDYFQEEHLRLIAQSLQAYQKAGGDAIAVAVLHDPWNHQTYDAYPSLVRWTKTADGMTYDYTWFDLYVQLNLDLGIDRKIKSFSLLPWEDQIYYYNSHGELIKEKLTVGSSEWQEIWQDFLTNYAAHLEAKGWFDRTYIAMDERPTEQMRHALELVQSVKNTQGQPFKISGAINYQTADTDLLMQFDDISISMAHLGSKQAFLELVEKRHQVNKETTIYNCVGDYPSMFSLSEPIESQFLMWCFDAYQADGFLRWALDGWVEDPFTCVNHWYWESGDPFLLYPHLHDEDHVYPTLRFKYLEAGLLTARKHRFLQANYPESLHTLQQHLNQLELPQPAVNEAGAAVAKEPDQALAYILEQTKHLNHLLAEASRIVATTKLG